MIVYILRRIISVFPVVIGVAAVVFTLFHIVGGDPAHHILGDHSSAERIEELRHELGLDRPLPIQFLSYLKQIVTFDYGRSYVTQQKIRTMILNGMGPSLSLSVPAFFVTLLFSIGIALFVAYFRGRVVDRFVIILCVAGMSIPSLAFILFGQHFLAFELGWFPISGYESDWSQRFYYLALPIGIWVLVSLGTDVRFFRNSILDEVHQDYVRTARAKGLGEKVIFLKHVLKNSLVPIISYVVIQIPFLILGSLLLENFFGIPGLGSITVDAVNNSDFPVLKAMATLFSLLFVFGQLVTDILYKVVDPRLELRS